MNKFLELDVRSSYRTGRDNLLKDFYVPVMSRACRYDRAVGYFSSSIFDLASQGLSCFFGENRGIMRLIFGGEISEDDFQAISRGEKIKELLEDRIALDFEDAISRLVEEVSFRRLELLSFLVASGRLQIKVALKTKGLYHEKIGIFYGENGQRLAFEGSANETGSAYDPRINWERIRTYIDDEVAPSDNVCELIQDFENLWSGNTTDCICVSFPEACKRRLLTYVSSSGTGGIMTPTEETGYVEECDVDADKKGPCLPESINGSKFVLRHHQDECLKKWQASDFSGIAELCTGAGKTIMAAYAIVKFHEAGRRVFSVISVPYVSLAEQWVDVLREFGISCVKCWGEHDWRGLLVDVITGFNGGAVNHACLVVVNKTFFGESFMALLEKVNQNELFYVCDEMHHFRKMMSRLERLSPRYRLGMSATPIHYRDAAGNSELERFFGNVVYSYDISKALEDGVLSPYQYHPHVCDFSEDERREFRSVSADIARMYAQGFDESDAALSSALRKRAMIVSTVVDKERIFSSLISGSRPEPLTLVYCGVDSLDGPDGRQIQRITKILADSRWKVSHFTASESSSDRRSILNHFRRKEVDALVSIRCLDEGIDIPGCAQGFLLASDSDPRQSIQRRGRLLRRAPGKKLSVIHDFLVIPQDKELSESERSLIIRELSRAWDFASTAMNFSEIGKEIIGLGEVIGFDPEHQGGSYSVDSVFSNELV